MINDLCLCNKRNMLSRLCCELNQEKCNGIILLRRSISGHGLTSRSRLEVPVPEAENRSVGLTSRRVVFCGVQLFRVDIVPTGGSNSTIRTNLQKTFKARLDPRWGGSLMSRNIYAHSSPKLPLYKLY